MMDIESKFEKDGFVVVNEVLNEVELLELVDKCESELRVAVGTRNLLSFDWVRELAQKLILNDTIKPLLPKSAVAVQCNYFTKDSKNNWFVTPHRDLSIPVKNQILSEEWTGWSEKQGTLYAQPPKRVLEQVVAVRVHLEDNNLENGALEVVTGSHNYFNKNKERVLSVVNKGGVLIMRPLILHSSAKLRSGRRRVLHFVFGPEKLPEEWAVAI